MSLCENLILVFVAPAFRRACACRSSVGLKADATKAFREWIVTPTYASRG
jgi:hypothetical protein